MKPFSFIAVAAVTLTATTPNIVLAGENDMTAKFAILSQMYDRFNAKDIDGVVAMLSEDVSWANGMDGGYEHGHAGIREYWTRQWALVNPHVEPLSFVQAVDGSIVVEVKQTIRDGNGNPVEEKGLRDKTVGHIFHFKSGKVTRFDIRDK